MNEVTVIGQENPNLVAYNDRIERLGRQPYVLLLVLQKCKSNPYASREHREWESFGRTSGIEESDEYPVPLANICSSDSQSIIRTWEGERKDHL